MVDKISTVEHNLFKSRSLCKTNKKKKKFIFQNDSAIVHDFSFLSLNLHLLQSMVYFHWWAFTLLKMFVFLKLLLSLWRKEIIILTHYLEASELDFNKIFIWQENKVDKERVSAVDDWERFDYLVSVWFLNKTEQILLVKKLRLFKEVAHC